ncbi:unnamed protein product, partial [Microthlaspi erraticum]
MEQWYYGTNGRRLYSQWTKVKTLTSFHHNTTGDHTSSWRSTRSLRKCHTVKLMTLNKALNGRQPIE